ncbi:UDP-3-O-(3-hydroxymyristoyl)glucosamine N-acyltransferase [Chitinilyticum piscinae]|nr:UDP-3-O-(3-hydroxymyristoyl)glucosamine N-acyltransferase [Chitinilyticum piscinae]
MASDLVSRLGGVLNGSDISVHRCASLANAEHDCISFAVGQKYRKAALESGAGALIVRERDISLAEGKTAIVVADDPLVYFARVLGILHPAPPAAAGIHPAASVSPEARLHPSVSIAANVVIEPGVVVDAGCAIGAGSYIGRNAHISAGCVIHQRVTVCSDSRIGERCVLHPGAVIGSDGFGNAWAGDHWEKIPQIGRVIIGNDVEIGANTTIDRGALDDTVIADNVRIDNLVQIAHNVSIGRHTAIAGCVGIAGSTHIGAGCLIGGGCGISGHLQITDRVTLLGGTVVLTDILSSGVYGSGLPAIEQSTWRRNTVHWRNLDEMAKRVRSLEKTSNTMREAGSNKK